MKRNTPQSQDEDQIIREAREILANARATRERILCSLARACPPARCDECLDSEQSAAAGDGDTYGEAA